ncbi:hypothetical protein RX13_00803 [Escherichia coli]|nr:hypothetical protein RX12_13760 [Escherichia coli]OYB56561.1 hypothetical protein RX15_00805 [Escherichia coli]OYB68972.1 hypothetical protein RX13_00803 [Escherichia coli]OYB87802.1 hypothetical protein RX14_00674 [Escherichia coli]OYB96221.1 hypothetical protein RX16_05304 [Escherichia coli]
MMSDITISRPELVNGHTDLLNQYPPHSGCTKECAAANRHTYPATG